MENRTFNTNSRFKKERKKGIQGEPNPFKWDWEKANFTIGAGASGGGFNAYGGIGWNNNYGFAVGYNGRDVTIGYISNGKPALAPVKDRVSEKWNNISIQINETFDIVGNYVSQVDWGGTSSATLELVGAISEIIFAASSEYVSLGLSTSTSTALCIDGGVRAISAAERLTYHLTLQDASHTIFPSNIGAGIGQMVDVAYGVDPNIIGKGQIIGSTFNNVGSFIATGGTAFAFSKLYKYPSTSNGISWANSYWGYMSSQYNSIDQYKKQNK